MLLKCCREADGSWLVDVRGNFATSTGTAVLSCDEVVIVIVAAHVLATLVPIAVIQASIESRVGVFTNSDQLWSWRSRSSTGTALGSSVEGLRVVSSAFSLVIIVPGAAIKSSVNCAQIISANSCWWIVWSSTSTALFGSSEGISVVISTTGGVVVVPGAAVSEGIVRARIIGAQRVLH